MTNTSNIYRKARALASKTVANGCTPGEAVSAANTASKLIAEHQLDVAKVDWPAAPEGYAWNGTPGRGGEMVPTEPSTEAPAKPKRKAKVEPGPKRPTRKARVIEMLRSKDGATLAAIMAEFGILEHSARAVVSVHGRAIGGVVYDKATRTYRAKA